MPPLKLLPLFVLLVVAAMSGLVAKAEDDEASFEPLCNGKNLDGWVAMDGGDFEVHDGMIVCTGRSNWPSWLRTEEVFENFVLWFEYKTYYGGEPGVYFAAPTAGQTRRPLS